jgi:hypothetical protein
LLVGLLCYLESFSNDRLAVTRFLMLDRVFDCKDMLTSILSELKIRTRAFWLNRIRFDGIVASAADSRFV